jgi:indole-3-glycerol phosphate synthase
MILDEICAHKKVEVAEAKEAVPRDQLFERIADMAQPRDFRRVLREEGISLIAEFKRASPSKGTLIENADPADLATLYEASGARAISVLTDQRFFQGSLDDLGTVHKNTKLPCLRKDFIIDEYQILEARAGHADAILLIVRILSYHQLKDYLSLAKMLGLHVLVETHTSEEIDLALAAGAHIIGINNRNLDTFDVSLKTTVELRKHVPGGNVLVSESGIHTRDDVRALEDSGVDAILVGEALVTSKDIQAKIRELLGGDEG